MKTLLPLAFVAALLLLCGCPDSKLPKAPPRVPEPKVVFNLCPDTSVGAQSHFCEQHPRTA